MGNASDGVDYAIGTMVWTLFDYYGEPPKGGFEVSSTYGQYDLCGFPKAASFWYRTQWLLTILDGPDKTFPTQGSHEVYLVESWESPDSFPSTKGNKTRAIHRGCRRQCGASRLQQHHFPHCERPWRRAGHAQW